MQAKSDESDHPAQRPQCDEFWHVDHRPGKLERGRRARRCAQALNGVVGANRWLVLVERDQDDRVVVDADNPSSSATAVGDLHGVGDADLDEVPKVGFQVEPGQC